MWRLKNYLYTSNFVVTDTMSAELELNRTENKCGLSFLWLTDQKSQERLTGLVLLSIQRYFKIDTKDVFHGTRNIQLLIDLIFSKFEG